nr:MAG TPA: hypothetical protein [Caudoviricetes sp.]
MKKEYTFKVDNIKCGICNNKWLYLDKVTLGYQKNYVCKCACCGTCVLLASNMLVSVVKEHLREVRRNEDNY